MPQMLQASSTANAATASTPVAVSNTATQNQQPAQIVLQGLNINTVAQQQQQQQQQQQHQQQQQQQQQQAQLGGGIQIVQQIVGPNGEVQQIPVRILLGKYSEHLNKCLMNKFCCAVAAITTAVTDDSYAVGFRWQRATYSSSDNTNFTAESGMILLSNRD